MDKTQKEKIREKFRNLDDGNFFDTGSDGNLYFHPDKVADWWLEQFDLAIKETEERMVRECCTGCQNVIKLVNEKKKD